MTPRRTAAVLALITASLAFPAATAADLGIEDPLPTYYAVREESEGTARAALPPELGLAKDKPPSRGQYSLVELERDLKAAAYEGEVDEDSPGYVTSASHDHVTGDKMRDVPVPPTYSLRESAGPEGAAPPRGAPSRELAPRAEARADEILAKAGTAQPPTTKAAPMRAASRIAAPSGGGEPRVFLGNIVLVAAAAFALFAALYHRLSKRALLAHPARRSLLAGLAETGPLTAYAAGQQLGLEAKVADHHLRALAREGFVAKHRLRGTTVYALPTAGPTEKLAASGVGHAEPARNLLTLVAQTPGVTLSDAARRLNLKRSHVHYHATVLSGEGLLEKRADGRLCRLFPKSLPATGL